MQRFLECTVIQITPHMAILVAVDPIDFRAGIDGLVSACRQRLKGDQRRPRLLRQDFRFYK